MKPDTFERLYEKCQDTSFLNSQNIGKEIPFYIIPYEPKEKRLMNQNISMTIRRLQEININVLRLDLFTLCIELLKEQ